MKRLHASACLDFDVFLATCKPQRAMRGAVTKSLVPWAPLVLHLGPTQGSHTPTLSCAHPALRRAVEGSLPPAPPSFCHWEKGPILLQTHGIVCCERAKKRCHLLRLSSQRTENSEILLGWRVTCTPYFGDLRCVGGGGPVNVRGLLRLKCLSSPPRNLCHKDLKISNPKHQCNPLPTTTVASWLLHAKHCIFPQNRCIPSALHVFIVLYPDRHP